MAAAAAASLHFVVFPFMSKGHTIPLLHLARLLNLRDIAVTIITTSSNSPFITHAISNTNISVINLSFPSKITGLPNETECTDQLPSMSLFLPFANATKLLQPQFEQTLATLPSITCIISDGFLGWTLDSASKFGIPRLVSYGMTSYPMVVGRVLRREHPNLHLNDIDDDEPLILSSFPWIKIAKDDFLQENLLQLGHPLYEFVSEQVKATSNSYGILFNTFYELERTYVDHWNREFRPRAWCLGPLCLADAPRVKSFQRPRWMQWLDTRKSVLYVAFGSQAKVSAEQIKEISIGLERSNVSFLWVVKSIEVIFDEFCQRVKDRGLIVNEWVDQTEILGHESVQGFLSHCGWNSVLESICAAVPILAWPMMAEQFFNAKLVEELGVGMRIRGGGDMFVKSEILEKMATELMLGDKGEQARNKVKKLGEMGRRAMQEGGSSCRSLDMLIDEVCGMRLK